MYREERSEIHRKQLATSSRKWLSSPFEWISWGSILRFREHVIYKSISFILVRMHSMQMNWTARPKSLTNESCNELVKLSMMDKSTGMIRIFKLKIKEVELGEQSSPSPPSPSNWLTDVPRLQVPRPLLSPLISACSRQAGLVRL